MPCLLAHSLLHPWLTLDTKDALDILRDGTLPQSSGVELGWHPVSRFRQKNSDSIWLLLFQECGTPQQSIHEGVGPYRAEGGSCGWQLFQQEKRRGQGGRRSVQKNQKVIGSGIPSFPHGDGGLRKFWSNMFSTMNHGDFIVVLYQLQVSKIQFSTMGVVLWLEWSAHQPQFCGTTLQKITLFGGMQLMRQELSCERKYDEIMTRIWMRQTVGKVLGWNNIPSQHWATLADHHHNKRFAYTMKIFS